MTDSRGEHSAGNNFLKRFSHPPDGIWSAPGRANLMGEHTDYNGGLSLPFAINYRTYAAVSMSDDRFARIVSTARPGETIEWSLDGGPPTGLGWASYPLGVLSLLAPEEAQGLTIAVSSDVPVGAGLSSSAALECSVAFAARDLWNTSHTDLELVALAARAENDIVGAPTGTMDQLASILGQADHAIAIDFHSNTITAVPLQVANHDLHLVIIDSLQRHDNTSGEYGKRRNDCRQVAVTLGVASLRDLIPDTLDRALTLLPEDQAGLVRHLVADNARVTASIDALRREDMALVGRLLTKSHHSLRDDFCISTDYIDMLVDICLERGALGARLVGGGFGGSVLALIPDKHLAGLREAVGHLSPAPQVSHAPNIRIVTPSSGARREA
jgi:galactokinase